MRGKANHNVAVVEDTEQDETGYAWAIIDGVTAIPEDVTYELRRPAASGAHLDDGALESEPDDWPVGVHKPLAVRMSSSGLEFLLGPDIVCREAMTPGVPVLLLVAALHVEALISWPDLSRARGPRRQRDRTSPAWLPLEMNVQPVGSDVSVTAEPEFTEAGTTSGPSTGATLAAVEAALVQHCDTQGSDTDASDARSSRATSSPVSSSDISSSEPVSAEPASGESQAPVPPDDGKEAVVPESVTADPYQRTSPRGGDRTSPAKWTSGGTASKWAGLSAARQALERHASGAGSAAANTAAAAMSASSPADVPRRPIPETSDSAETYVPLSGQRALVRTSMPVDAEYNPQKSKHPASAVLLLLAGALLGVGALTAWSWQFGWPQPLRAGPGWQSAGLDHSPYLLLGRLPRVSPSGQKVDDVAAERYLDRAWAALPHDGEEGGFWMKWDAHARLVAEKNGFAGIATELGNAIAVTAVDRAAISVARNFWEMAWLGRDCGALRNLATVHADGSGKQLDADLARPWLQELLGADCEGEGQPLKTNTSATRIYQSELTVTAPAMPSVSAYDLLHIDGAHATRVDSNPQLDLAREADFREALKRADGLLFGKSGETSRSEAEAWLKRAIAIQLGRSELLWALTQLGTLYLAEDAEPQRFARARFVWEAAAAFGDTVAMCFLQQLHEGPLADSGGARIWAERARTAGGCPQSGQ